MFRAHPNTEMSKFINAYKSASSRLIKKDFPEVKRKLWKEMFWSRGYCLLTTGGAPIEIIRKYIESQGRFSFGKSVADNGWNMFTRMLEYKLAWQGKQLVKIDKWYPSSQLCHVCGFQNNATKDLSLREWYCPKCGSHHNRDKNAAINIREVVRLMSA